MCASLRAMVRVTARGRCGRWYERYGARDGARTVCAMVRVTVHVMARAAVRTCDVLALCVYMFMRRACDDVHGGAALLYIIYIGACGGAVAVARANCVCCVCVCVCVCV